MQSIGMPEDMIVKMRYEQKEQMKQIIQQDPGQQVPTLFPPDSLT